MVPEQTWTWKVGDRIDVVGHRGTVRYVGDVAGTTGDWLGIEWDDATRGKHDGSHQGISYFSTCQPSSGSFVRPAKVTPTTSCVDAIKRRYGFIEDHGGVDLDSLAQVQKDIRAKFIEVVGAEKINKKQSQFKSLQLVSLRDKMITDAGFGNELGSLCPNIRELDLSKNLIKSWRVAGEIAGQLPHLQLINLSENLMEINELTESTQFDSVEHIILARNKLNWDQILRCCKNLPNLKVLQAPFNNITSLAVSDCVFSCISSIDLEGNCLGSWSQVNYLGTLSHLTSLNVTACSLTDIHFPDNSDSIFPALEHLLISGNLISDWCSVSELDKLTSLKDLKFVKNPILEEEDVGTNFQLIIARIYQLKTLNGQAISTEERRGAELDFLKRHGREFLQLQSDEDRLTFHRQYPCYLRLVQCYGPPEESELKSTTASLKNSLIQIELTSSEDTSRIVKKKVPLNMTVQKLTGLVQRIFNTGLNVPRLFYLHSTAESTEVELDNELKDLNFFSVEDGSRIVVRW